MISDGWFCSQDGPKTRAGQRGERRGVVSLVLGQSGITFKSL